MKERMLFAHIHDVCDSTLWASSDEHAEKGHQNRNKERESAWECARERERERNNAENSFCMNLAQLTSYMRIVSIYFIFWILFLCFRSIIDPPTIQCVFGRLLSIGMRKVLTECWFVRFCFSFFFSRFDSIEWPKTKTISIPIYVFTKINNVRNEIFNRNDYALPRGITWANRIKCFYLIKKKKRNRSKIHRHNA